MYKIINSKISRGEKKNQKDSIKVFEREKKYQRDSLKKTEQKWKVELCYRV